MPKFIPVRNVDRMFPFEFYEELREVFDEFIPWSAVFTMMYSIYKDTAEPLKTVESRKAFYKQERKDTINLRRIHAEQNLIDLDITPVLVISPLVEKDDIDPQTGKQKISTSAMDGIDPDTLEQSHLLCVQYFDSNEDPVFCEDISLDTIHKIPEILWDDPNLLIGVLSFLDEGSEFMIVKAPEFFKKLVDSADEEKENE